MDVPEVSNVPMKMRLYLFLSLVILMFVGASRTRSRLTTLPVKFVVNTHKQYGHWEGFAYLAPLNIAQAEAELSGTKKVPRP